MSKTTEVVKHLARFVTNCLENRKLAIKATSHSTIFDIRLCLLREDQKH